MNPIPKHTHDEMVKATISLISETNGVSLSDTLDLLVSSDLKTKNPEAFLLLSEFKDLVSLFTINRTSINSLLNHPVSTAFFEFFKRFPLKYNEEHIHLTGALTAEFIFPRLKKLLAGPQAAIYESKIKEVYGESALPIHTVADVDKLIRLKEGDGFARYLKILYLPKLVLVSKEAHEAAAFHLASEVYQKYNVGRVRLKFSLSRSTSDSSEQIPGLEEVTSEDVVVGLYNGFQKFKDIHPDFDFILSPSFRKEAKHFDSSKYSSRKDHLMAQINELTTLNEKYPFLAKHLIDVDTVGDEKELYRKEHFNEIQPGFRKLQYRGFRIRSHHGETWHTLKKGIQAVDNAMNIWHIDTLEHGLSLGINPNYYFHRIFQNVSKLNSQSLALTVQNRYYRELDELDWGPNRFVLEKIQKGEVLTENESTLFLKAKFHTAREVEHYQHDVLNRLIQKGVTLVSLASSNKKLTGQVDDFKDHPFSWWEKKSVQLGVGTDNYVTLNTNFINEMLILLYSDPTNLKITKLLMVTTGETRRPYISHLLWKMRKLINAG